MSGERLLLVSATGFEIEPVLARVGMVSAGSRGLGTPGYFAQGERFDCLITGVGQAPCAVWLSKRLGQGRYDRIIQAGLAGSFTELYPKRSVVVVGEELFGDSGAEDRGGFLDLFEMGLVERDSFPFSGGALRAPDTGLLAATGLPIARSVTVNRTLSDSASIDWIRQRYSPEVVNMEGSPFFYACLTHGVPFIELRAVSDMVGPRDKAAWDIAGAIAQLNHELFRLLAL
ncbi:MAG: futalosine hydrolase [Pseudomonadota bacterium]